MSALAELAVSRPAAELVDLCTAVLEPLLADRAAPALLVMAMVQLMVPHLSTPQMVRTNPPNLTLLIKCSSIFHGI